MNEGDRGTGETRGTRETRETRETRKLTFDSLTFDY